MGVHANLLEVLVEDAANAVDEVVLKSFAEVVDVPKTRNSVGLALVDAVTRRPEETKTTSNPSLKGISSRKCGK